MKSDPLLEYRVRKKIEQAEQNLLLARLEEARQIYTEVLAQDPTQADAMRGMGVLCLQQSKPEEGEQWLNRALDQSPEDPQLWNDLGEALRVQSHYPDAIEAYGRALALKPDFAQAMNNLGVALMLAGDLGGAEQRLRAAIDHDPAYPHPHNNLGVLLERRELPEQALRQYEISVQIKPDFDDAIANYSDLLERHPELAGMSVSRLIDDMGDR